MCNRGAISGGFIFADIRSRILSEWGSVCSFINQVGMAAAQFGDIFLADNGTLARQMVRIYDKVQRIRVDQTFIADDVNHARSRVQCAPRDLRRLFVANIGAERGDDPDAVPHLPLTIFNVGSNAFNAADREHIRGMGHHS